MATTDVAVAMATAAITITLREEFGLTTASVGHPEAEFRYLAGIEEPDRGLGLVEVRGPAIDEILAAVEATEAVREFELLDRSDERAVFQYETDVAALYRVVREAGIIPAFPYTIRNGELLFTTTTTAERLSRLAERLRSLGVPFDVTSVAGTGDEPSLLTERQHQFVETAVEAGYYDTPRECTLTELAAELGVASSTASLILHRAEERLVKRYVDRVE
jgi:hypothetical protein